MGTFWERIRRSPRENASSSRHTATPSGKVCAAGPARSMSSDVILSVQAMIERSSSTMDFRPREALFFGDNFFRFGPIGSKISHLTFQPKRRFLSIWSVNKKSIIRVLVIAS